MVAMRMYRLSNVSCLLSVGSISRCFCLFGHPDRAELDEMVLVYVEKFDERSVTAVEFGVAYFIEKRFVESAWRAVRLDIDRKL